MRYIKFFLLLFLPFVGFAQQPDADALLDKVVATMKNDAPLQMDYSCTVYEDDGTVVLKDKGIMRLDGNCYSLVMDKMGVWCDGETQWSYMLDIDEVYITDAASDEAQNLSPLFIIENFRKGYSKKAEIQNGVLFVTLQATAEEGIEKVLLGVDAKDNRLKSMTVFMTGQGYMQVLLDKYQINCIFASDVYKCPIEELDASDIIDMR
jgi:outer membrane lipoprotein-sorting protein